MGEPTTSSLVYLLILGIVFHLFYIRTIFDCYFTDPVVNGMQSYSGDPAPAKRLVLIVADGLRADLLLEKGAFSFVPGAPEVVAPYLRTIIETRGAFGVSHTRVPSESRPGHVALIGGVYEDVSSVTKGWQEEPADFDSVFNRSSHTFSFGSPDILPIFVNDESSRRIDMRYYGWESQDFSKSAVSLDIWVLEQLRSLLLNARDDPMLSSTLREPKTVFFLHLLGLDMTGHSYRPHSEEYMANIQAVDEIVREAEQLFSDFYQDEQTAFVFTADHGMSTIGNHGDGDPENTRTPLIAWGAGVRGPLLDPASSSHDAYSATWDLSHLIRRDVDQADVAALMTVLLGADWPVNSVGVLPDIDTSRPGYLSTAFEEDKLAKLALANAKVILEHFRVKQEHKMNKRMYYAPFVPLNGNSTPGLVHVHAIEALIQNAQYTEARKASAELVHLGLEGLRYLQRYDGLLIQGTTLAGYLGWIALLATFVFTSSVPPKETSRVSIHVLAISTLIALCSLFYVQQSPWAYYLYVAFPCYFWDQVLCRSTLLEMATIIYPQDMPRTLDRSVKSCGAMFGILCMVFGYTHRWIWSVGLVGIALLWPLYWPRKAFPTTQSRLIRVTWACACLITAVFPSLRVDQREHLPTILIGAACMLGFGVTVLYRTQPQRKQAHWFRTIVFLQCVLILAITVITASSVSHLQAKLGLPSINCTAAWAILSFASLFPFTTLAIQLDPPDRITIYLLGFSVCFIILCNKIEGLFYVAEYATLVLWTKIEITLDNSRKFRHKEVDSEIIGAVYRPQMRDLRIAVFFLFFIQVGFFGAGNFPSISSFYLEPVYRLVTVSNPFLLLAILMFKLSAPYVVLSACFAYLHARMRLPPFKLFLLALMLADVMTLAFFLRVSDTGSWSDISQNICSFFVSSLLQVLSTGVCVLGELLVTNGITQKPKETV